MAEKSTHVVPHEVGAAARREPARMDAPLTIFDRFADELDRVFDDFGFGRRWFGSRWSGRSAAGPERAASAWAPDVEVYQRDNDLVVRADLPGMKKEDVNIDVTDSDISISGERRQEQVTEREGVYRSERVYGSFYRTIPLPEGALTDEAKATFKDGVLEIRMPAPPQSTRSRRLSITGEGASKP